MVRPRLPLLAVLSLLAATVTVRAQESKQPADSTLAASLTLKDVELSELLTKLELKLDYAVSGKVTVKANVSVPLGEATSSRAYRLKGQLTSPELKLEGLRIRDLSAEVLYADGKLTLTSLKGTLPPDSEGDEPGEFHGSATAAIEPRGDLTANLTLTRLPLGELLKSLPGGVPVAGAVSGKAQFRGAVNTLSDPSTWVGSAELSATTLTVFERAIRDVKLNLAVQNGKAVLKDSVATVEGVPVSGEATLTLADKYPLTATVRTQPKDVSELQKLVPELELPVAIRGKLETTTNLSGTLNPFTVAASGTIAANDLRIGESVADKLTAKWSVTPERINVTDLSAGVFSGKLSGSASVPLKESERGEFAVKFTEIDAAAVAKAFPKVPVKLTGLVSGTVKGTVPVAKPNEERAITADVDVTAPKLAVQGIPAEKLTGKLSVAGTALKYELEGKTLGGSFEINGQYPQAPKKTPDATQSRVLIRGIDLAKLAEALKLRGLKLRGVVDLTFVYASDLSEGSGRYSIRGLGWNNTVMIPELSGRIRMREGTLELTDAVGPLASGTVRARLRLGLDEPARNFFRITIDRFDVQQVLGKVTGAHQLVEGGVSLTVRGKLWPEFQASGTLGLANGRLAGLTANDVRVPFTVSLRGGGGELVVRDAGGTIGNGRLTGQFEYLWGANGRLKGDVKFTNVRIGNVLADLKQSNYFANARTTGRIELKGENMTSVDDLTGTINASLEQAAVRDLPVINSITPFVSPTAVLKPFDTGELRGRLSRGVFRIERLTLANPTADLYADGSVTLAGRLDLGVILRTGQLGLNDTLLQQAGLQLPIVPGPLPLSFIRDISVFLSNRTLRLSVTGTIAAPQVRLNTSALLTEEAIRYLIRRYLPAAAAAAISNR